MPQNGHIKKLPNAPLQEVIFELRWNLKIMDNSQLEYDPLFERYYGIFDQSIRNKFQSREDLTQPDIPRTFLNYTPKYRYRKSEGKYPLIQIGQGILSVNDTEENYEWEDNYLPLIRETLNNLCSSFNNELQFNFASLKYIDAIELKNTNSDYLHFLNHNLKYKVTKDFELPGKLTNFNFIEKYTLEDGSKLGLTIATGLHTPSQQQRLVWQNAVTTSNCNSKDDVINWLDNAHQISSNLFKSMVSNELYDHFKNAK